MQNYGKKIAELRLAKNMTQAQLGKELNVTAQAVSKWEKGASEPDLNTIKSLCEIFGITPDEFFSDKPSNKNRGRDCGEEHDEYGEAATECSVAGDQGVFAEKTVVVSEKDNRIPIEVCSRCGKKLYSQAEFKVLEKSGGQNGACDLSASNPREVVCADCLAKEKTDKQRAELCGDRDKVQTGIVVGVIVGAIAAIITAVGAASYFETVELVLLAVAAGYAAFAFTAQCFYSEFLIDMLLFFCRSLKFPMIIFTFDLDGIAFLICLKILFAIIGAAFSITVFLFGLLLCLAVAAVTFPFSFSIHKRKLAEREAQLPKDEKSEENSDKTKNVGEIGGEENEKGDSVCDESVFAEDDDCFDD